MSEKSLAQTVSRREFLKMTGAAAGTLALPSQLLAFGKDDSSFDFSDWPAVRLGMLMPDGEGPYQLKENFLAGFNYCLKTSGCIDAGVSVELVHEECKGSVSVSALKRLVNEKNVSLVTGILNNAAASALSSFARDEKFVLVAGSLGECMARKADVFPATFHCSMNYWQTNWAMGRWAAGKMGPNCVVATSFYETGYDTLEVFRTGYQSAGGTVRDTLISDAGPGGAQDFDRIFSKIDAARPDFIYALYSGQQAADFMKAYASSDLVARIPLAVSSYLPGGDVLPMAGPLSSGTMTCLPWQNGLFARAGSSFGGKYGAVTGRSLDAFGLLGYETAGMILSALSVTRGKTGNIMALARAFEGASFSSPRGQLNMDPRTNTTSGPLFIHEVGMDGGKPVTKAIAECTSPSEYDRRLGALWVAGRSGWHNAYLYA